MKAKITVAVVGNPNCGKTTLFNGLTGIKQQVGNWPGVTVERKTGRYQYLGDKVELVDLPGTYSMDMAEQVSIDEKIAREYIATGKPDLILNIIDASNLERNLYLTSQLLEMRVPIIIALNMMDVAGERGYQIDVEELSARLDCPVIAVVATSGNLDDLKSEISRSARSPSVSDFKTDYDPAIENAIRALAPAIKGSLPKDNSNTFLNPENLRWLTLSLLEGEPDFKAKLKGDIDKSIIEWQNKVTESLQDDIDISVADSRYGSVNQIGEAVITRKRQIDRSLSDKIDRLVLNRILGIPIFLIAMYLMFMFTINIGGAFIDFFDIATGTVLVDGLETLLASFGAPDWLMLIIADGIGGGIQVVATFIPVIAFLYLFLGALEDSGYMARAAFVMDRAMRAIGLPGKAFVPLIVGFGCNVPAIMATRTMEHHRDRVLTIVMAPFMSCGARLPVYALFAAAFFQVGAQNVVFGLYLIGIAVAVLTGLVMKKTILEGQATPFIMELPAYHVPTLKGVGLRTWDRTKTFVFRAGKIIVPMVLVLNVLNAIGTDGSYGNEDSDKSMLSEIGRAITPAFAPMGMTEDNWPAAVGIFTGVLAKEAVVGTLDSLYGQIAENEAAALAEAAGTEITDGEEVFSLWTGISEAVATIPANLGDAMGTWGDPLGVDVGDVSTLAMAAEQQEVSTGTYGAMAARFDGAAGAFAYLLFILLYFPCVAALAAVYREANMGWALFVAGWTTGIGYVVATVFYQLAIFSRSPITSLSWIFAMLIIFTGVLLVLRYIGLRQNTGTLVTGE